jgi:hypothetical protein
MSHWTEYDELYKRVSKLPLVHHKIQLAEPICLFMEPLDAIHFLVKVDMEVPNPLTREIRYTINPDKYPLHLYSMRGSRNLYVKLYEHYQLHPTMEYNYLGWAIWGLD